MRDQEDIPANVSELIRLGTIATVNLAACNADYFNAAGAHQFVQELIANK